MEKPPVIRTAFIRTMAIVTYFDFLYSGYLGIPARVEEVDEVVKQRLNIKKTPPEKKQCFGRSKYETIYYAVGDDQYGNAVKFAYQAACLFHRWGISTHP